jgi:hypothetical protein
LSQATDPELETLADELALVAQRLSEVAIARLQAAADGADAEAAEAAVELERRINRARRSVEKAAAILAPPRLD